MDLLKKYKSESFRFQDKLFQRFTKSLVVILYPCLNGKYIREFRQRRSNNLIPSVVWYSPSGYKMEEEYYFDGKLHRDNGPAVIKFERSRKIIFREYWIHGKKYSPSGFYQVQFFNLK